MSIQRFARFASVALCVTALALPITVLPSSALAADTDCDGVEDAGDNCPSLFNPDQADLDGDSAGNRCDDDKDGDAALDDSDNCPGVANADQSDADADGAGDACDHCADTPEGEPAGRNGCTVDQLCPCSGPAVDEAWKSADQYLRCVKRKTRALRRQRVLDRDEASEILDFARESGCGTLVPQQGDNDGDGVADENDNCVSKANPSQLDTDGDTLGNACDTDRDNDGVLNRDDNCPVEPNAEGQADDADGDTLGDSCDACPGTGLVDIVDADGCSVEQLCNCDVDDDGDAWGSHARYLRCVADEVFRLRLTKRMTGEEAAAYRDAAAANSCGALPEVCE